MLPAQNVTEASLRHAMVKALQMASDCSALLTCIKSSDASGLWPVCLRNVRACCHLSPTQRSSRSGSTSLEALMTIPFHNNQAWIFFLIYRMRNRPCVKPQEEGDSRICISMQRLALACDSKHFSGKADRT